MKRFIQTNSIKKQQPTTLPCIEWKHRLDGAGAMGHDTCTGNRKEIYRKQITVRKILDLSDGHRLWVTSLVARVTTDECVESPHALSFSLPPLPMPDKD